MGKEEIFVKYDLEKEVPDDVQFTLMEMPNFFHKNGDNRRTRQTLWGAVQMLTQNCC